MMSNVPILPNSHCGYPNNRFAIIVFNCLHNVFADYFVPKLSLSLNFFVLKSNLGMGMMYFQAVALLEFCTIALILYAMPFPA